MLEYIEAFLALKQQKTMGAAATHLRVSQSAISKRIATLEGTINKKLIEKSGRKVKLTEDGEIFAQKAAPLLTEWKMLIMDESQSPTKTQFIVGISESIMYSWGASVFRSLEKQLPYVKFEYHTHRSPGVLDRVESGDYHFGLSLGIHRSIQGLILERIWLEPFVLIPANLKPVHFPHLDKISVVTIEKKSDTWQSLKEKAAKANIHVEMGLESFIAAAQMAVAGFAHGLVPFGVADALNIDRSLLFPIFKQDFYRPIQIVARKNMYQRAEFQEFKTALLKEIEKVEKDILAVFPKTRKKTPFF